MLRIGPGPRTVGQADRPSSPLAPIRVSCLPVTTGHGRLSAAVALEWPTARAGGDACAAQTAQDALSHSGARVARGRRQV